MRADYHRRQARIGYVWHPALSYAAAYTIFALAVKLSAVTAMADPVVFVLMFCIGALPPIVWAVHKGTQRRSLRKGPTVRWHLANGVSGAATLVIVMTTVGAYLVDGVTILFALLLMRLGVIMMAPVVDLIFGRHVRPAAWLAFTICVSAAAYGLTGQSFAALPPISLTILVTYLAAYAVRLALMTHQTKNRDRAARGDWFLVEMMMTALALAVVCLIIFVGLASTNQLSTLTFQMPSIIAGLAYGYALVNGTLIYLDWRENAHSVSINRAASLVAGLGASLIGSVAFGFMWPSSDQWVLAALTASALVILGWETLTALSHRSGDLSFEDEQRRDPLELSAESEL
ncbi:MAG: hypothetical protein AAFV37_10665 [Pseudomonadota bacterium]